MSGVGNTEDGLPQAPMPLSFWLARFRKLKTSFPDSLAARVLEVNRIASISYTHEIWKMDVWPRPFSASGCF